MRVHQIKLNEKYSKIAEHLKLANTDDSYGKPYNDMAKMISEIVAQGLQLAEEESKKED